MMYLNAFKLPSELDEMNTVCFGMPELDQSCYSQNVYPFKVFPFKKMPVLKFEPITIFYGNNGSGKSTLLNIISEKLRISRNRAFNKTPYFNKYLEHCKYSLDQKITELPSRSAAIASDDVFDFMLDIRSLNEGVDHKRRDLFDQYENIMSSFQKNPRQLKGLDDYDEFKELQNVKFRSRNSFVSPRLATAEVSLKSNGENALLFFMQKIEENSLYLLDEPENSLSAAYQVKLSEFIESSARFFGCQFIIATHSPFLLSIKGAKIYDLDCVPVSQKAWTELENVRIYQEFFEKHRNCFISEN